MNRNSLILPYAESPAAYVQAVYVQYDPRAIGAAADVVAIIEDAAPWAEVEHIGSTAIPGCAGKGIVDLMAMYPTNRLVATRAALYFFDPAAVGEVIRDEDEWPGKDEGRLWQRGDKRREARDPRLRER